MLLINSSIYLINFGYQVYPSFRKSTLCPCMSWEMTKRVREACMMTMIEMMVWLTWGFSTHPIKVSATKFKPFVVEWTHKAKLWRCVYHSSNYKKKQLLTAKRKLLKELIIQICDKAYQPNNNFNSYFNTNSLINIVCNTSDE